MIIPPKNQPFMCLSGLPFLWLIQISPILSLLSPRSLRHSFVFPQPPTSSRCSTLQIPPAMASEEGFPCFISPHRTQFPSCHPFPSIYYLLLKYTNMTSKDCYFSPAPCRADYPVTFRPWKKNEFWNHRPKFTSWLCPLLPV